MEDLAFRILGYNIYTEDLRKERWKEKFERSAKTVNKDKVRGEEIFTVVKR